MAKVAEAPTIKEQTEKLCDDIEAVQMKLQTLEMVLGMYGEATDNTDTQGFCNLIAGSIEEAKMNLFDISETIETMGVRNRQLKLIQNKGR